MERTPTRARLRDAVYARVFGDQVNKGERRLLVLAGEAEAKSRRSGRIIMEGTQVVGFGPEFQYSEDVCTILTRLGMKRLTDDRMRDGALQLFEPLDGQLGFYVGIMRLGLGTGSPQLTLESMARDWGVSTSKIRREEAKLIKWLKSPTI